MTPETLTQKSMEYWRDAARYSSEKYLRCGRIKQRFVMLTVLFAALLGIAVVVIIALASARPMPCSG